MNMMTMRIQRGADGTMRHMPAPAQIAPKKHARKRLVPDPIKTNGESAAEQLRILIERLECLEEEARGIADDKRDVLGEAKARGYDAKALKAILKIRQIDPEVRAEHNSIMETYLDALGIRA